MKKGLSRSTQAFREGLRFLIAREVSARHRAAAGGCLRPTSVRLDVGVVVRSLVARIDPPRIPFRIVLGAPYGTGQKTTAQRWC